MTKYVSFITPSIPGTEKARSVHKQFFSPLYSPFLQNTPRKTHVIEVDFKKIGIKERIIHNHMARFMLKLVAVW